MRILFTVTVDATDTTANMIVKLNHIPAPDAGPYLSS